MAFTEMTLTIISSILASSGIWMIVLKMLDRKDDKSKLLVGLAHDRILELGIVYINRGWITHDEYENLVNYLYTPYKNLGGNGSAERIINEVNHLSIRSTPPKKITEL